MWLLIGLASAFWLLCAVSAVALVIASGRAARAADAAPYADDRMRAVRTPRREPPHPDFDVELAPPT